MDKIFYIKAMPCRIVVKTGHDVISGNGTKHCKKVKKNQIYRGTFSINYNDKLCFHLYKQHGLNGYYAFEIVKISVTPYPPMKQWQKRHLIEHRKLQNLWLSGTHTYPEWNGKKYSSSKKVKVSNG